MNRRLIHTTRRITGKSIHQLNSILNYWKEETDTWEEGQMGVQELVAAVSALDILAARELVYGLGG